MLGYAHWSALAATASLLIDTLAYGATLEEWRGRSIYQVMTDRFSINSKTPWMPCQTQIGPYCGGSWRGIRENLDYIQGMGFDAIWVSPIVAQLPQYTKDGRSYAGYWQQDLFTINNNFGTPDDLHQLIDEVHSRGMLFMLDIVVNHMAYNSYVGGPQDIDYSVFNPFNDESYFHPHCDLDYSGNNLTSLEVCWLGSYHVPLADLKTDDEKVQKMFGDWIEEMVGNWSVDGLRIDAGVNVQPDFFPDFMKRAGVFGTAEVYHKNVSVVSKWQAAVGSTLNYPLYWPLTDAFQINGDFGDLVDMMESEAKTFQDVNILGTFSENQDIPRFGNHTSDLALAINVATFVLMADGIPIIYQGQEQHFKGGTDPFTNREPLWETGLNPFAPIYQVITSLNALRHHVINQDKKYTTSTSSVLHQDDHTLVMAKGSKGTAILSVFTNGGEGAEDSTLNLDLSDLGYQNGAQLKDVLTCQSYTLDGSKISLPMTKGAPMVLYPADALDKSSLCGSSGDRFLGNVIQTVTATTMTATIDSTPTVIASTVSYPIVSSEVTSTSTATASGATSSGRRASSTLAALVGMAAVAMMSGLLGCSLVL